TNECTGLGLVISDCNCRCGNGIAMLIWNYNIRYVDASKASILSNLEPFVAMIMGLILLYKPITGSEIIGSLFIVGGVVLSTYQRRKLQLVEITKTAARKL